MSCVDLSLPHSLLKHLHSPICLIVLCELISQQRLLVGAITWYVWATMIAVALFTCVSTNVQDSLI